MATCDRKLEFMGIRQKLVLVLLAGILAGALRFCGINFDSLWLDEGYQSLVGACGQGLPDFVQEKSEKYIFRFEKVSSVQDMLSSFRQVDPLCPPLYAVLLNRWMSIFGNSDLAIRSLSAIISSISVSALVFFAAEFFGMKAAICCGLVQLLSPFDVHYAQEARMYSLLNLSALLSSASLIWIIRREEAKAFVLLLPLYAVSTWAMINTHYTGLFLAAAQGVATVFYLVWKKNWKLLGIMACAWLSVAILWLPWLKLFFQAAAARTASFYVSRIPDWIWPFKALFIRIPLNWIIFLSGQRVNAYAAGIYASSAIILIYAAFLAFKKNTGEKFYLLALWMWALLPALGLWLIDLTENHRVVEIARYLMYTAPAIYLLAGFALSKISNKRYFTALIACHCLFASANLIYTHTTKQREPWLDMAKQVEELVPVDETLVVSQHYDIACLDRYLSKPRRQLGLSPAMGADLVKSKLASMDEFALLTAQEGESIKEMVPGEFSLRKQVDLSHGLHLRLYRRNIID